MSDVVIVSRDVGRRAENLIVAGGSGTVLKGVELLLQENVYVAGSEVKVGPSQTDCSALLKKGLNTLQSMPFELLGLDFNSGTMDVRKSYKKLALKYHPDKNPKTTPLFQLIQNIQSRLTDSTERLKEVQQAAANRHGPARREAANAYAQYKEEREAQPQAKPNVPPPKPNPSAYQQYQQQYQQYQQQQQQQQQQQHQHQYHYGAAGAGGGYRPGAAYGMGGGGVGGAPAPSAAGFNYYDSAANSRAEDYRRKNYYEDLLREQYRKAAEAEKRAKEYANKFQTDNDTFSSHNSNNSNNNVNGNIPKPSRPSYPPSDNSSNGPSASSKNKSNDPTPPLNSYKTNINQKPAAANPSAQQPSQQQQYQYNQYNYKSSSNDSADKYTTGQTYRTTSDGRVYPQQQQQPQSNKYNPNQPQPSNNAPPPESAKYNYSYNPATGSSNTNPNANAAPQQPNAANNTKPAASTMVPRPFAFKIVNKSSGMVELEWKTSSFHNCPLAVELSWRQYVKQLGGEAGRKVVWEMSSKLIRSGVCRKKNLTPGMTYEFRVRAVEEYDNGQIGQKSEWTDSILTTLPVATTATEATPTPDEMPRQQPSQQPQAQKQAQKQAQPTTTTSSNSSNPSKEKKVEVSMDSKPKQPSQQQQQENINLNSNQRAKVPLPPKDSEDELSSIRSTDDTNSVNHAQVKKEMRFRRFNSKFGVQEKEGGGGGGSNDRSTEQTQAHHRQQKEGVEGGEDDRRKAEGRRSSGDRRDNRRKGDETNDTTDPLSSKPPLQHHQSFLSASARLAWGKETLGRESNTNTAGNNDFGLNDEDVTYLEVEEELDEAEDDEEEKNRKKAKKPHLGRKGREKSEDEDSTAEIEDEEEIEKQKQKEKQRQLKEKNKNNNKKKPNSKQEKEKEKDNYQDDFEIIEEEEEEVDGFEDQPIKNKQHQNKKNPAAPKNSSIDAEEVESEYTDSDTSSIRNPSQNRGKPAKDRQGAVTPPDLSSSNNYGSESENNGNFDIEEERIFLLYPPKDNSTPSNTNDSHGKRIYRHPVHKEPFARSEVKGYLFVDQNVMACANCGDWLRVKIHVVARHLMKASANNNDEWGWCLRKDKSHVYLRLLEGKNKMQKINPDEKPTNKMKQGIRDPSPAPSAQASSKSSQQAQKPSSSSSKNSQSHVSPTSSNGTTTASTTSNTTTTNGIAAGFPSFHSPPSLHKHSSASLLNKSLRNIPKPALINPNLQKPQPQPKESKKKNHSKAGGGAGGGDPLDSARMRMSEEEVHQGPIEEWIECFDEKGNVYYFNEKTNESKWEPPEWFEEEDPTTGSKYYVHVIMKEEENIEFHSTWTKPKQFSKLIHLN